MSRMRSLPFSSTRTESAAAARTRRGSGVAAGLALGLGVLGLLGTASADMAPGPPPAECVGKPDGTLCVNHDGTAGKCKTGPWGRQAGRTWVFCEADKHECDHLELGAVCHGYLGKPAHCKEFTSPEKKTWRTCTVDGSDAPVVDSPATAPAPAPTTAPAPAATTETPAAPPPAAKKGLSCTAVPGAAGAGSGGVMALWAAALGLAARRRFTAKS